MTSITRQWSAGRHTGACPGIQLPGGRRLGTAVGIGVGGRCSSPIPGAITSIEATCIVPAQGGRQLGGSGMTRVTGPGSIQATGHGSHILSGWRADTGRRIKSG
jgi:hypothetical protein